MGDDPRWHPGRHPDSTEHEEAATGNTDPPLWRVAVEVAALIMLGCVWSVIWIVGLITSIRWLTG